MAWIRQWLWSGSWFCGIDIKDDFLHVPIHKKFRKFLRFNWGGKLLEWQVLPFGLKCSPRILTSMVFILSLAWTDVDPAVTGF